MLQLDEKFRVSIDSSRQNFQLEKLEDIKDKSSGEIIRQEYKIVGYHGSSLRSVLLQYKNEAVINDSTLVNIHKVFDKLVEIDNTIIQVVKKENIKLAAKQDD